MEFIKGENEKKRDFIKSENERKREFINCEKGNLSKEK